MKKYKQYPKRLLADPEIQYSYGEIWTTLDGQTIPICNLRPRHIKKIIEHVKSRTSKRILPFLYLELERRKKDRLIKKTKIGKLLYGR